MTEEDTPTTPHPDLTALGLSLGGLPQKILRHLQSCPSCRQGLAAALAQEQEPAEGRAADAGPRTEAYGLALDRAARRSHAQAEIYLAQREEARRRLAGFVSLPRHLWSLQIGQDDIIASLPFLDLLLVHAGKILPRNPEGCEAEARFALRTLDLVRPAPAKLATASLRVRAWALIGYANRRRGTWSAVDAAFATASRLLAGELGSDDEADFCLLLARAYRVEGRLSEALALAARAAAVAGALGETAAECEALEEQVGIQLELGDVDEAGRLLARELLAVEAAGDLAGSARLRYRLAVALLVRGRYFAAARILAASSLDLSVAHEASRVFSLVVGLVESDAAGAAERLLRGALERARQQGSDFDAALAALALIGLYLGEGGKGRSPELRQLAPLLAGLADSEQLAPDSRRALRRLAEALRDGCAPPVIVVAQALRFAQAGPPGENGGGEPPGNH